MADTLHQWLDGIGLAHLAPSFEAQDVSLEDLPLLSDEDLRELGIPLGPRRRILHYLRHSAPIAPAAEPMAEADLRAERRQLTVMFIDLVGSTAMAETLDPEDMRDVIRLFQDAASGVIARFDGYVAEFLGDGILAYFGWPRAHEDDAERACRAGLALVDAIAALAARPGIALRIRVGIATGLVVVGDSEGGPGARRHSVIGATPNLAARLQTLAEPGTVVASAATAELAGAAMDFRPLGRHRLKGIEGETEVLELTAARAGIGRFEARIGRDGQHALSPMLGRGAELELLRRRWAELGEARGRAVLLTGEAGIGKSRITRAVVGFLGEEAPPPALLQCSPYHSGTALWPLQQTISDMAGLSPEDAPEAALDKLDTLISARRFADPEEAGALLARFFDLPGAARYGALELSPQARRQRLMACLTDLVLGQAGAAPGLVLVEDLHWVDPTTLELLRSWVRLVAARPAFLVMTSRPENSPGLSGAAPVFSHVALNPLARESGWAMAMRLAGGALPPETVEAILTRSEGVPLYVEELTKAVLETGEPTLPASLQDSLMARLDQFPAAKLLVQIAAAMGREFDTALLAAASGQPEGAVRGVLDQLAGAEIVFPAGGGAGRFAFKHALLVDAAYQTVLKSRRRAVHGDILRAMLARAPEERARQPEILAHHASEAGLAGEAAGYWHAAAERAMEKSANLEAMGHYRRALAQIAARPDDRARREVELDLYLGLGVATIKPKSHGSLEVRAAFTEAERRASALGDLPRRFRALRGLWHWHSVTGDFAGAERLSGDLSDLAEASGAESQQLMAQRIRGYTQMTLGAYGGAGAAFSAGLALYDPACQAEYVRAHGEDPGLWCYAYLSWVEDWMGRRDRALRWSEEGVAAARRLPHRYSLSFSLGLAALLRRWRGDAPGALAYAQEAEEVARDNDVAQFSAWAAIVKGWAVAAHGDWQAGLEEAEAGFVRWKALGLRHVQWRHLVLLADICRRGGQLEQALAFAREAEALVPPEQTGLGVADLHITKGGLLIALGQGEDGEAALRRAHEIARAQKARLFELRAATGLAHHWWGSGRHAEGAALLRPLLSAMDEGHDTADYAVARALLEDLEETA